jgi:hypothetical protein
MLHPTHAYDTVAANVGTVIVITVPATMAQISPRIFVDFIKQTS